MKRLILPIVFLFFCHFSIAQICSKAQLPTSLQNGLVSFYPFCGNANDGSGNALNATLNQGALTQDRFGNSNSAIAINGSSQRIEFPVNSSYNTTTFSISFWTKGNSYNIHNKVQLGATAGALRWSLNWNETNINFSPMTCAGGYAANYNLFNSGMPLRQWNHIVYVVEGTSTKVYKNGVYVGVQNTASALTCFNTSMKLCFGGDIGGGSIEYYDGAFDDILFYDRAITSAEASQLYSLTSNPCSISTNVPSAPYLNYLPYGTTVAGRNGAVSAANQLTSPHGVAVDAAGNIYVADFYNNRIQKWAPGAISGTTVAGGNGAGYGANQLNSPTGVVVDAVGDIYIADQANHRIQKWVQGANSGITIAGGNGYGSAANQLHLPSEIAIDLAGNIYVLDYGNNRVQKWVKGASSGITVAGGNGAGSDPNQLYDPFGITIDASGNIYLTDRGNNRVQKWAQNALVGVTVAGGNGIGSAANQLDSPYGVAVDVVGNVYVSDGGNNRVQKWVPNALVGITVAGGNGAGSASNQIDSPGGVAIDGSGNLYVSDGGNHRVQRWAPGATLGTTVAGGNGGGVAVDEISSPSGLALDASGGIYVADLASSQLKKWNIGSQTGLIVAGANSVGSGANQFNQPSGVVVDLSGNIYVADFYNNRVQKWAPGASSGTTVAGGNGGGAMANQLNGPVGVAIDPTGNLFIADGWNHRVQKWIPGATSGITVAGGNGEGAGSNQLNFPSKLAVDAQGNIFIADYYNHRIQKWAPGATFGSTVAGGNGAGSASNQLNKAAGVALDVAGNIYVADRDNNRVQKWLPGATFGVTVAGGNGAGFAANQLNNLLDVTLDAARNIYIADYLNSRIQKWSQQDTITLCVGETATALSATADVSNTLRWYGTNATGGTASTTATIPNTLVAGIFNYYVSQVSTATGCESPRTRITVVVNSIPYNPLLAQLSSCTSVTLDAGSGFASYSWNTGATSQTITPTSSGEYRVTIRNASGCVASDTINVNITKADIIQNNSTICKGSSITLSVDSAFVAQNLNSINLLPSNLKVGLKAFYPFSGNANDVSGNNNNGTVTGATLTTDRFGNANSAYSFNGSSFIDLGNISGVGYSSSQDITMSFWINEGATGTVISKYTNLDAPKSNFFFSKATNSAQVAGNGTNSVTVNNITDYRWANYIFVASAGTNKSFIYRNGILVATGSLNANGSLSATKIMLGRLMGSPSNFFTGKIDDVFIYNRVLTAAEISQLSNFQPKVTWSTGATTNAISVTPTATTKYFATISDGINSCVDSVTITVSDIGSFNPFVDTIKVCGDSVVLDAGAGYNTYSWSNGAITRTITPKYSGRYSVSVVAAAGCSASDTSFVSIIKAKIIQRDTTICIGSAITLAIDSTISGQSLCSGLQLSTALKNGLVGYFPFCGNANDASGNGNNGNVTGATLTTDRFGNLNSAYNFSGNNQYISVIASNLPRTSRTTSLWFKTSNPTYRGILFGYGGDGNCGNSYFAGTNHRGTGKLMVTGHCMYNETSVAYAPPANEWVHFVTTSSSSGTNVYVNGKLVATSNKQFNTIGSKLFIGANVAFDGSSLLQSPYTDNNNTGDFWLGGIDDVMIYNRELTNAEVLELYTKQNTITWSTGASTNSIIVSPTTTTKYFVTVTDGITTCQDSITVTVSDIGTFNPLQDTVKVCGDGTLLDAGAGYATYKWSNGATTRTISAKASGKYFVTVANSSGCNASDTGYVSIVKAKIFQKDTTICIGSSILIKADAIGVSSNSIFKGPNQKDSLIISKYLDYNSRSSFTTPNLSPGNYYLKVSGTFSYGAGRLNDAAYDVYNGITSKADRFFTWNEFCVQGDNSCKIYRPSPDVYNTSHIYYYPFTTNGGVQTIYGISDDCCWGDNSGGLTFEFYKPVNNDLSITWSNGDTTTSITVNPTVKTTYFVTVSDGITTCKDSITVTVSDIGTFNPLQDTVKVCGDSLLLDAGAGYATYNWSNGATTRTITAKASGKYFVNVANVSGCSASDTSVVSIVNAKILQPDTTICKGSAIKLNIDSFSVNSACDKASLPLNLQNGLVAFYPFCGNANDASMNGFDGIVNGAKLTQDRFGKFNSAYSFDKKLFNYISLPLIRPLNNIKAATFSFWVKTRESNSSGAIFGHWRDTNGAVGDSAGVIIGTYSGNKIDFSNYSGIGGIKGSALNIDIWHHIVIVVDLNAQSQNSKFVIYRDGIIDKGISIDNFNNILGNATSSFIGRRNIDFSNFGDYFDGLIDDLFIFNRPLSQFEITQLYGNLSSVLWSTGATTTSIVVNPTVKTTYKVTVTDGITTCTDSVVVDVSSSELKVTDPAAVCSPTVVNLTTAAITSGSANGLTYTYWRDANATQALVNPDKVSVSGTYYIVGTSSTGCTSAPTAVKVTINPLPIATIVTPTQTAICDKSSISLTATGGTSYQWLFNGSAIVGATDSTYAASQAGSYEVNVISLGCTSKVAAPVNLTLIKAAIPKFSNSSTCIDLPVSFFNETDTTLSGSVNYVWDLGDGQTSTLFNPVYTYKKSGTFVVKLTVTPKLCSSLSASITKNITVDVPPFGIRYPNVLAVKNKPTPLSARFIINGYTYLWMPSTGLNNGAIQKPIFNASNEQLYRVRLTSPNGCITMDTVKVSVYDSSDIFVPKAFSPNKDGKNDLLQPFLVNIVTLKFFRVYNRWGQLMFQSSDSKQGWDGMYNYKPQPLETYTWIAEGIDGNGITIFRKGQTVLIR